MDNKSVPCCGIDDDVEEDYTDDNPAPDRDIVNKRGWANSSNIHLNDIRARAADRLDAKLNNGFRLSIINWPEDNE